MKKKRKAFTLIELLAVIIVLAIIALIAMPIIFNVIENAKLKSLENSAYGVVDAVRLYYMENLMNSEDGTLTLSGSVTGLTLSGEHPTGGTWEIQNGKEVTTGRGIKISGVTFASMQGYVCDSEEVNNELTGKVICLKDSFTFTTNNTINENGWAKEDINVKVTAEGVSDLKYCLDEEECTPNQTLTDSGVDITTEGTNYLCVSGDNTKVRCNAYNLDKQAPKLTIKEGTNEIVVGENIETNTYFMVTYGISGEGNLSCTPSNTSNLIAGNQMVSCTATGKNGLTATESVEIKVLSEWVDGTKANKPKLFSNMIPVTYNNTTSKWTYANIYEKWYNYADKEWANAVVLKANSSTTYSVGDPIDMDDIAQMYVWIPRYKYTIFNGNNGSVETPIQINVEFEEGTATTGSVRCHDVISGTAGTSSEVCTDSTQANNAIVDGTSTYTHPAFCFGRKNTDGSCNGTELEGIWVGKFEVSGEANAANLTVIPNVSSLVKNTVSSYFSAINGVANTFNIRDENNIPADSHMMKNMEWGAVAYLKQSEYGLGTTDIALNNYSASSNPRNMTGCGSEVGTTTTTTTCTPYNEANGQAASTTGNIYGVYDMSGGAWEFVMGNMVNESGNFYVSSAGTFSPAEKYYDAYTYSTSNTTHGRGKLGDATKETLKNFGNDTGGWYGDFTSFPCSSNSWFRRGGNSVDGSETGVFIFYSYDGSYDNGGSTRLVVSRAG